MFLKRSPDIHISQFSLMILLSGLLLFSQLSAADHDLDHPFHHHDSLCDTFLAFDGKPSTTPKAITFDEPYLPFVHYTFAANSLASSPIQTQDIRGPPTYSI